MDLCEEKTEKWFFYSYHRQSKWVMNVKLSFLLCSNKDSGIAGAIIRKDYFLNLLD